MMFTKFANRIFKARAFAAIGTPVELDHFSVTRHGSYFSKGDISNCEEDNSMNYHL